MQQMRGGARQWAHTSRAALVAIVVGLVLGLATIIGLSKATTYPMTCADYITSKREPGLGFLAESQT
jgi:hypothetical protein